MTKQEHNTKYRNKHKETCNAASKRWREENPDAQKASKEGWKKKNPNYQRDWHRRTRKEVLDHYGGKCACCGEATFEFLAIDHINGGGSQQKKELGMCGHRFTTWLKSNNFPEGFQVLCHCCNASLGYYGYCPHHPEITRPILRRTKAA